MNARFDSRTITVHGRGSFVLPVRLRGPDKVAIDLTDWALRFEVDGASIAEAFTQDTAQADRATVTLERTQIEELRSTYLPCAIVAEQRAGDDLFCVLWTGHIVREGFVGAPDDVEG